jgi:hypothetical protein
MFINVPLGWLDVFVLTSAIVGAGLFFCGLKAHKKKRRATLNFAACLLVGGALLLTVADTFATNALAPRKTISGAIDKLSGTSGKNPDCYVRIVDSTDKNAYFGGSFSCRHLSKGEVVEVTLRAFDNKVLGVSVISGGNMGTEVQTFASWMVFPLFIGGSFIFTGLRDRMSFIDDDSPEVDEPSLGKTDDGSLISLNIDDDQSAR